MPPPVTQAGKPPAGKKKGGIGTGGLIVIGLVAVGGVIFLLWRRSQANAAANTATGTDTAGTPAGTAYPDWSGEISVMQTEIGDLQGALAEQEQDLTADEKAERTEDKHHRRHPGGDSDHDKDDKPRCPKGYHFLAVSANSDIFPAGGRRVKGGFCVPDRRTPVRRTVKRRGSRAPGIRNPVLVSPRR